MNWWAEQMEIFPPSAPIDRPRTRLVDLGYLAGIVDGEGWVSVKPSNGGSGLTIGIGVNMTDLDVLQRCQSICRLGSITGPRQRGTNKPIWSWNVYQQRDVVALLLTIYALLSERRQERVREAIVAWQAVPPRKRPEPWGTPGDNQCGTYAGWAKHHRHGDLPVCDACRDAANAYRRARRKRY